MPSSAGARGNGTQGALASGDEAAWARGRGTAARGESSTSAEREGPGSGAAGSGAASGPLGSVSRAEAEVQSGLSEAEQRRTRWQDEYERAQPEWRAASRPLAWQV
jgi:hypothetical protein